MIRVCDRRVTLRVLALALGMLGLTSGRAAACEQYPQPSLPTTTLELHASGTTHAITAELAMTEEQRACGLMGRPPLGSGEGMLFDMRPPGPAFFWMDNTPEPLDMLFADGDGVIVHIEHEAVPLSRRLRGTRKPVAAVLELAGGAAERLGIGIGDRIALPWNDGG